VQFSFTHHDPLEDTESAKYHAWPTRVLGFTHHDPLEDTESGLGKTEELLRPRRRDVSPITIRLRILKGRQTWRALATSICFTHHDPLEDTESAIAQRAGPQQLPVSPITIRLRILKVRSEILSKPPNVGFTHHDPLEDTERALWLHWPALRLCFTHHDPLEDTESRPRQHPRPRDQAVSPITIRLRILKARARAPHVRSRARFTHHDPLEDTESNERLRPPNERQQFHPSRSA